ncbi:hypothetical protein [Sporomusa aerivorans]|uniref:hypothetical protein n=1 Tax=Sporomusa aerivorans TaxID=204936 RepID=UPI00352A0016
MSSRQNHAAAQRKPSPDAMAGWAGESTGYGGQAHAAAPRANGPAGSKGAANCAAEEFCMAFKKLEFEHFQ